MDSTARGTGWARHGAHVPGTCTGVSVLVPAAAGSAVCACRAMPGLCPCSAPCRSASSAPESVATAPAYGTGPPSPSGGGLHRRERGGAWHSQQKQQHSQQKKGSSAQHGQQEYPAPRAEIPRIAGRDIWAPPPIPALESAYPCLCIWHLSTGTRRSYPQG